MACTCAPADILKEAWASDSTLNGAIPATTNQTNAFYEEGLPPNLRADRVPKEYAVVEDFGSTNVRLNSHPDGVVRSLTWQLRLRIYSKERKTTHDLATAFRAALHAIPETDLCWDGGHFCKPVITSDRTDLTITGDRVYEFFISFNGTSQ